MAIEIECKYLDVDHELLRARLAQLGAVRQGRWFESNEVFDDATRSLKACGTLLRLRQRQGRSILTLKRASCRTCENAKVYEEHETEIGDPEALRAILTGLGYVTALRYEKIREKWILDGCEVCLDQLPFGSYAEIEGDEDGIAACALALGLPQELASKDTYHELNRRHRVVHALPPDESFVFEPEEKARLLARRGTD